MSGSEVAAAPTLTVAELAGLAHALAGAGEPVAGPLTARLVAGGRSNLTFRISDQVSDWVLRMPPRVGRTPSAHDVAREFRVMSALVDTAVPVARPVVLCEDDAMLGDPFAVAAFVDGRCIQTQAQLAELSDDLLEEVQDDLVRVLAALHGVDHVAAGLVSFARPDGYAERQFRRWAGQWDLVGDPGLSGLARSVIGRLGTRLPRQLRSTIVHGDFRIDNTLLRLEPRSARPVVAVVDWELATLGDPLADVAMMCAYRAPAFDLVVGEPSAWTSDRLASPDGLADAYVRAGGAPLEDRAQHLALAYFKIAVIAAGIDHRRRAGAASGAGFDTAGAAVEPFLSLAEAALRSS